MKDLSTTNIKTDHDYTLGESAPSLTTIKYLVAKFKRRRMIWQDEHRGGQPVDVSTPEMVKKTQNGIGRPSVENS